MNQWKIFLNGGMTVKLLLVLMLTATQLLAGSGDGLYLCVSNDGLCYCVDSGPESCTCCQHDKMHESSDEGCCCCRSVETCSCPHDANPPQSAAMALLAGDTCGCTHILIAVEQPTSVTRMSVMSDAGRLTQLVAQLPIGVFWNETVTTPSLKPRWIRPPEIADFALIVVSTAVIRC